MASWCAHGLASELAGAGLPACSTLCSIPDSNLLRTHCAAVRRLAGAAVDTVVGASVVAETGQLPATETLATYS